MHVPGMTMIKLCWTYSFSIIIVNLLKGPSEGQENQAYLRGIQQRLINMDTAFTELENSGNSLPTHTPSQSINTMALSLEPENESFEVKFTLLVFRS